MAKQLYVLFVRLADATYCSGVYDSKEKYEAALAEIGKQIGEPMEEDEYDVLNADMNEITTHLVEEYLMDDEDGE